MLELYSENYIQSIYKVIILKKYIIVYNKA